MAQKCVALSWEVFVDELATINWRKLVSYQPRDIVLIPQRPIGKCSQRLRSLWARNAAEDKKFAVSALRMSTDDVAHIGRTEAGDPLALKAVSAAIWQNSQYVEPLLIMTALARAAHLSGLGIQRTDKIFNEPFETVRCQRVHRKRLVVADGDSIRQGFGRCTVTSRRPEGRFPFTDSLRERGELTGAWSR